MHGSRYKVQGTRYKVLVQGAGCTRYQALGNRYQVLSEGTKYDVQLYIVGYVHMYMRTCVHALTLYTIVPTVHTVHIIHTVHTVHTVRTVHTVHKCLLAEGAAC